MLTKTVPNEICPRCATAVAIGIKEEPTGWKVYVICPSEETNCPEKMLGMIPRTDIDHADDVITEAERLLERDGDTFNRDSVDSQT